MKKILFSAIVFTGISIGSTISAQHIVYQDSFEGYSDFAITNVGSWTLKDVDLLETYGFQGVDFLHSGEAKAFQVFNSLKTTPQLASSTTSNWDARTGEKMMVSFSSVTTPWNDDWLISPKIQLASDGGTLSFYGKGCHSDYGAENFQVFVSTTGTDVTDFTSISSLTTTPSDATWHQYTYDLSAYAGQQVHIAIRCTSNDQFGFAVDDFKITTTVAPTSTPNCSTNISPLNGATNNTSIAASLNWSVSNGAESYDVYLDTNPNPTTLVANTLSTSYIINLSPTTTYYWKIVPKNSLGSANSCSIYSFTTAAINPPGCVTNVTPIDGATGIAVNPTPISWAAPTTGGTPISYDVYWGTNASNLTKLGNTTNTAVNITNTSYNTTYYWQIVAVNNDGTSTGCPVNSFTTGASLFEPYCGPLAYSNTVEPITKVTFAGIENTTSEALTSLAHEIFLDKVAQVNKGETYTIKLEGNTNGNYKSEFAVFIDWNNNEIFEANESYKVTTSLQNSTGIDGKEVTFNILVPNDASVGLTRMRVKKIFGTTNLLDACTGAAYGQAEDYSINIGTLAVSDFSKTALKAYPNPVKDIYTIESQSKIKSVKVFNITGQQILTKEINETKSQIDFSKLNSGVYIVTTQLEDGSSSTNKVIKK